MPHRRRGADRVHGLREATYELTRLRGGDVE